MDILPAWMIEEIEREREEAEQKSERARPQLPAPSPVPNPESGRAELQDVREPVSSGIWELRL
jgi:hypothetical protein